MFPAPIPLLDDMTG